MTDSTTLAPCPFCGGAARHLARKDGFYSERVICGSCSIHIAHTNSESAIVRWNHRAPAPASSEVVAWGIFDSQGYYQDVDSEAAAKDFCDHYNKRQGDPLKPYRYAPLYTAPQAQPVAVPAKPVATVESWTNGSYHRNYKLTWHADVPDGTELFTAAQVQAMLAAGLAPGWQAVPVEPTEAMVDAAESIDPHHESRWAAYLAAAPQPAAPSGPAREPLTDEMVLAAARVLSPQLFKHGLDPLPGDGPVTSKRMESEAAQVRKMLVAAHGITAAPKGGQHGAE